MSVLYIFDNRVDRNMHSKNSTGDIKIPPAVFMNSWRQITIKHFISKHYTVLFQKLFLFHILLRVFYETPDHQYHDDSDRECRNDADTLNIVHRTLTEYQCDRQYDQQDTPQQNDQCMRFFIFVQLLITIAGSCVSDRIETRRIKCDHAYQDQYQERAAGGHGVDNTHDQFIEIPAGLILCDKILKPCSLLPKAVISQDHK